MRPISKFFTLALALIMLLALSACGGNSASSAASDTSSSGSASSVEAGGLVGSPWVTSVLSGNLPAEQPEVKDDLYTHYNYDYLAAHQGENVSTMGDFAGELQTSVVAIVKDESKTGRDLDQLRVFFNQAADLETLKATGLSEIKPYLDRIDAVRGSRSHRARRRMARPSSAKLLRTCAACRPASDLRQRSTASIMTGTLRTSRTYGPR